MSVAQDMERDKRAVDRRIAELGPAATVVWRTPGAAVVKVAGEYVLLDGGRLANDPAHKGLRLLGADLALRAEHAAQSPTLLERARWRTS